MDEEAVKQESADEQAANRVRATNTEPVPTYYVNNVRVRTSIFDMKMEVGHIVDVKDDTLLVENQAVLIMSPQHAKSLSSLLTRRIAHSERLFGKIPSPPEKDGEDGSTE